MSEVHKFSDMGEYHDDDIRLNNYSESADIKLERTDLGQSEFDAKTDTLFVDKVVQSVQMELGWQVSKNPSMSANEIKLAALSRFIELTKNQLLTKQEADQCYKRFAYLVDYYYGAS